MRMREVRLDEGWPFVCSPKSNPAGGSLNYTCQTLAHVWQTMGHGYLQLWLYHLNFARTNQDKLFFDIWQNTLKSQGFCASQSLKIGVFHGTYKHWKNSSCPTLRMVAGLVDVIISGVSQSIQPRRVGPSGRNEGARLAGGVPSGARGPTVAEDGASACRGGHCPMRHTRPQ